MINSLFIEPEDVLLFRDGKPFDAGADHNATSLFPPSQNVVQGAIRSHHLVLNDVNLNNKTQIHALVGTASEYGSLRIRGPFIAKFDGKKINRYFPAPADATPFSEEEIKSIAPQKKPVDAKSCLDEKIPLLCWANDFNPGKKEYGVWLEYQQLLDCLTGKPVKPVNDEVIYLRENRIGIKIQDNRARCTEEGQLYQAEFIRVNKDIGLYIEFEGYNGWPGMGHLRLGGEGHGGRYQLVTKQSWPDVPQNLGKKFKVYFASPAYFSSGWKPANWFHFFEKEVDLFAVALIGYETIGGYNLSNNIQKAAVRYIPAGSVYYFITKDGDQNRLLKENITESPPDSDDIGKIGFGQVIINSWNN